MCTPQEEFNAMALNRMLKSGALDAIPLHEGDEDSPERKTQYVIFYPGQTGPIPVGQVYAPGPEHEEFASKMGKLMVESVRNILDNTKDLPPDIRAIGEKMLAEAEREGLAAESKEEPAPDEEWLRNLLDR